ncbi:MAG: hypothetical protein UW70_C0016G0005 [Candidatus Peregrinibacteria bacterium GW2011_GWA2_44_7]|nr:MAG: hypothetical protein UW70_C0016G0005 [Candidatus Peregrinibacteria bacterium GW2011_GWA2_44_7]
MVEINGLIFIPDDLFSLFFGDSLLQPGCQGDLVQGKSLIGAIFLFLDGGELFFVLLVDFR